MRVPIIVSLLLAVAGCAPDGSEPASTSADVPQRAAATRGGTITIGDETWSIVPSIQCSVYPGNVVSIAGHAASDPALEIVIDYGGPTGVRVGEDGSDESWHALRDTLDVEISGKHVRGTASFSRGFSGAAETVLGSFDVSCT